MINTSIINISVYQPNQQVTDHQVSFAVPMDTKAVHPPVVLLVELCSLAVT